jgi:hypothetical protein
MKSTQTELVPHLDLGQTNWSSILLVPVRALVSLARLIGIQEHQAEDALYNERAAQFSLSQALSRRSFISAGAALAAGTAFSFYKQVDHLPWNDPRYVYLRLEKGGDPYSSYGNVAIERSPENWEYRDGVMRTRRPISFPQSSNPVDTFDTVTVYSADGRRVLTRELAPSIAIVAAGVTPVVFDLDVYPEHGPATQQRPPP